VFCNTEPLSEISMPARWHAVLERLSRDAAARPIE
jgi:hypothetical protein